MHICVIVLIKIDVNIYQITFIMFNMRQIEAPSTYIVLYFIGTNFKFWRIVVSLNLAKNLIQFPKD